MNPGRCFNDPNLKKSCDGCICNCSRGSAKMRNPSCQNLAGESWRIIDRNSESVEEKQSVFLADLIK